MPMQKKAPGSVEPIAMTESKPFGGGLHQPGCPRGMSLFLPRATSFKNIMPVFFTDRTKTFATITKYCILLFIMIGISCSQAR